jgi:pimeloyl-ACP methyl ester carboxylesterase
VKQGLKHRRARLAAALVGLVCFTAGCATPIGVTRVSARQVNQELTQSALSSDQPSAPSLVVLNRLGLYERYQGDPEAVLAELHAGLGAQPDPDRLYALAELSFMRAEQTGRRAQALAAAVYAYAFLFPGEGGQGPGSYDPRLGVARNVYNRGLTLALRSSDGREILLEPGTQPLPFGAVEVTLDPGALSWAGYRLERFVPTAELSVRGLRNRYRYAGVGMPLAASLGEPTGEVALPTRANIPPRLKVPVTAFLRLDDPAAHLASGRLRGQLELYSEYERPTLEIQGKNVPLERETTSSLAYMLEGSPVWEFELAGFRSGDFLPFAQITSQLVMLQPHRPDRIPLVLVHGTASSPARWAELVNEIENDAVLGRRYEVWLFIYNTGNPIGFSGGVLVQSLKDLVAELDPEGRDPALRQMVVIGHSQGGLLTKLTTVASGTRFWDNVFDESIDQVKLSPESRALFERSMFFEPLPFVSRVVFIATPHRGSYLTQYRLAGLVTRLVKAPFRLTSLMLDVATQNQDALRSRSMARLPTSLDNMTPGNPALVTLSELPVDPRITAHVICGVVGGGPPEQGGDGVVKYTSCHLDGVASELIVDHSHSMQADPVVINEVRRILAENLAGYSSPAPVAPRVEPSTSKTSSR